MENEKKNTKSKGKRKSKKVNNSNINKNTQTNANSTKKANNSSNYYNKKQNSKTNSTKNNSNQIKKNNSNSKNNSSNNKKSYQKNNKGKNSKKNVKVENKTEIKNNEVEKVENVNNEKIIKNVEIKEEKTAKNEEIKKVKSVSSEETNKSESPKKHKKVKVWVLLLLTIFVILLLLIFSFGLNLFSKKIQNNIYIENINVSKLSIEEAKNLVKREYKEVLGKKAKYLYNEKEYEINLEEIDFEIKIDEAIQEAYNLGKDKNIINAMKEFYLLKLGKTENIQIDYNYNKEKFDSKIKEIEKDFYKEVKQHSYRIEENKLIVSNGSKGISIDYNEMENEFRLAIDSKSLLEPIQIPIIVDEPQKIDVEKIHNEVYVEVKDAYYTIDPFEIHEEVKGIDFDSTSLKNMIEENLEQPEYTIDLIITEPAIKVENLDLYNDELGRCSTSYVNNPNRTVNLRLAASKIDGFILMPGETFSYNDVVGERTVSAGYKNAAIYVNGEVEDGLAGGICQISSTLYDAVVFADLEIVERSNHARVPSYLPAGKDATVYWGSKDFKFKNNRSYPIKISMTVGGGYATAVINGKSTDNEYDISIETGVVSRYNGYLVVNAYKVYRQNGEVVKRELLSTDSYKIG